MSARVHIVAVAARTPVGLSAETSAAAVRAGVSRVMGHPYLVDANGEYLTCGYDRMLPSDTLGVPRIKALLDSVLIETLRKLSARGPLMRRLTASVALPLLRPGYAERDAAWLQQLLVQQTYPHVASPAALTVETANQGHAGFVAQLAKTVSAINAGRVDLALVGGVDSYLNALTLDWLDADRKLARAEVRGGFPPGEGAAMIAIASDAARSSLGLPSLATVQAVAHAHDATDEASDEGLQGDGLTQVFNAVASALPAGARFDDVYVDLNDERSRTTDYAFALLRCGALFRDGSQYNIAVGETGELGAASAAFNCVRATCAFTRGYAIGDHALVSSASWDGLRGAVLLGRGRG